ncbi:MAG TPA: BlaI/MecI/CopY family transcriptional regulator [Kofleriaceae bacterium]|nr:BlaI/MecI/CopY family transcriptional regulator [Kofleriaceae bacterium]
MSEPRCPELTPAEFNLMKVLWRLRRATVAETRAALGEKGDELAYTTVMTLLGRLAAKGAVVVDREREPYVYKPAFRRESVLRDRLKGFLADVFDGEASSMVLHLVDSEQLSIEELRAIEKSVVEPEARAKRGKK